MHILLMIIQIILAPFENFFSKQYDVKAKHFNLWLFSSATILGSAVYFLICIGFKIIFVKELIIYAFFFALCYAGTMVASVLALKEGLYATTMLIHSYSITIPTLFGVIFLHENVGILWYIGFALTCISIYILNNSGKEDGSFSFKWLFYVIVSFVCNGVAVIVLKLQQIRFGTVYDNLFMVYSMLPLIIVFLVAGVFRRKSLRYEWKQALLYGIPRGAINGVCNFLNLIILGMIPTAVYYPMSSSFSLVGTCIISVIFFREKFSKKKLVACVLGLIAGILLNM